MNGDPKASLFYVDDGYPESSDYDDNYRAIGPVELRELLRARLAGLRPSPGSAVRPQGTTLAGAAH